MDAAIPNLTKSERETLKAIYRLTTTAEVAAAHTGDLAEALKVSPGTMTATAIWRPGPVSSTPR